MHLRPLVVAAALAAGMAGAQAASINFGTVSAGATLNLVPSNSTRATGDSFYTFNLSSTVSNVTLSLAGSGLSMASLTGLTSNLFPVALLYTMPQSGGTFSFGSLAAGTYQLFVGGFYSESFTGSMKFAAPVPEASQGLMFLAGLGGIAALVLHRRRQG